MSSRAVELPGPVHVVAAVLEDPRGRILLTRRTAEREFAGLWEFPGGKVEPGEAPLDALAREIDEELGIAIGPATPLIRVPCAGARKRLLLDVYRVESFSGRPHGRESQATAWVTPQRLPRYGMPPADRPVVAALLRPDRMLVTPDPQAGDTTAFLDCLETAAVAGIAMIQLRCPSLDTQALHGLAAAARERLRDREVQLLVNGDPAVAASLGLGLHLRASQLMALGKRPLPATQITGASCHSAEELKKAEDLGLDYAVLGPVQATATHPGAQPLGWDRFLALREQVSLPIYAIGGLTPEDLPVARHHGAQGIAAIRSLWNR